MSEKDAKIYVPQDMWTKLAKKSESNKRDYGFVFCELKNDSIHPFYISFNAHYNITKLKERYGTEYMDKLINLEKMFLRRNELELMHIVVDPTKNSQTLDVEANRLFTEPAMDTAVGKRLNNNIFVYRYNKVGCYRTSQTGGKAVADELKVGGPYLFKTEARGVCKENDDSELGKGVEEELLSLMWVIENSFTGKKRKI